jgi:hypothetical protein
VGVNQHFFAVEPEPFAVEILRPIDTIGVMSARLEAPEVDVPEKESLVVGRLELNDLDRLDVLLPLKQKQLDASGVSGEDREIYSLLVDSSTQGVGSAGLRLEWSPEYRLPSIAFLSGRLSSWHRKVSGYAGGSETTALETLFFKAFLLLCRFRLASRSHLPVDAGKFAQNNTRVMLIGRLGIHSEKS